MVRPRKDQQINIPARAVEETICLLDEREAAGITLADVAVAVGCRAPALYAYFDNKDALLRAVHDEGFRMMLQEKLIIAARNADDPLDRLRKGGLAYVHFAFERPGLYQLMFSPPRTEGLSASPFESDPGAKCLALLHAAVVSCQAEGYLSGADAVHMAFVLWSTVHGAASLVLQGRAPLQAGQDSRTAAVAAVDTLMSFIQSTRPEPDSR